MRKLILGSLFVSLTLMFAGTNRAQEITNENKIRFYNYQINPRQHPDDKRRWIKPPDAFTFDNQI